MAKKEYEIFVAGKEVTHITKGKIISELVKRFGTLHKIIIDQDALFDSSKWVKEERDGVDGFVIRFTVEPKPTRVVAVKSEDRIGTREVSDVS